MAYDMTTLLTMYQSNLESKGVDASSYSKQHLQKHYGDELIFHTPTARFKPELIYGSTIMVQDILNAWVELQSKKEEERIENEIFRVVKHIKKEISEMGGICTAPLNVNDVSLECAQRLIPDSLYLLLRLMITSDITKVTEVIASKAECKNSNEEWLVISIAQDIMYCCGKSRVKLPKNVSLAMCVQHLTGSKTLVTLLNRMGHCCGGAGKGAGVWHCSAKQYVHLAANNNDINEETLDGKNTTHATTIVVYQKKSSLEPPPTPLGHHGKRRRSLQTSESIIDLEECSVHGKRPVVAEYAGHVDKEWFKGESDELKCASSNDVSWKILRLNDRCLSQDLVVKALENQSIPSWSGFHSILFPDIPQADNIGYCPLIEGSSTDFSTIYTVLKQHIQ